MTEQGEVKKQVHITFRAWWVSLDGRDARVAAPHAVAAIQRAAEVLGLDRDEYGQNVKAVEFGTVVI